NIARFYGDAVELRNVSVSIVGGAERVSGVLEEKRPAWEFDLWEPDGFVVFSVHDAIVTNAIIFSKRKVALIQIKTHKGRLARTALAVLIYDIIGKLSRGSRNA